MRAVVFERHGRPDVLKYTDYEDPRPSKGEVLVEVKACALNHLDLFVRQGWKGLKLPLPHILGSDISGVVVKGSGFRKGQRVLLNPGISCAKCSFCKKGDDSLCSKYHILGESIHGGYAELVSVPARNVVKIPNWLSFNDAASLPLTFLTAWRMLKRANLKRGEDVLIVGAGGGVSIASIQLAKCIGANVHVTSRSLSKLKQAKKLGADVVINSRDYHKKVQKMGSVNVVIDSVGEATMMNSLKSLSRDGRLVTCGTTSGPISKVDMRHVFWKQLSIIGSTMGSKDDLSKSLSYVFRRKARPVVAKTFKLKDAVRAHKFMENGKFFGKIVLEL